MADKRQLLLQVDVDADSKPLRELGDAADDAKDDLDGLNRGLKSLDEKAHVTSQRIHELREEISRSGDLGLIKDLQAAEREMKKIDRDRKSLSPLGKNDGAAAAEEFSVGLFGRLGPLMAKMPLGPAGAVIGAGLAAGALPVIGGAIVAAFAGGAGIAGIAGGIALAAKDPAVKSAASGLKQVISSELIQAAKPFVPEVVKQIGTIRSGFEPIRADIEDIFRSTSKMLTPLTEGGLSGITKIVDGIKSITTSATGAGPVIREIGNALDIIGGAIGDVFTDLSDNGDEAAGVIRLLAYAIADVIRFVGDFANATSNAVRPMVDFGIAATNMGDALFGWLPGVGGYFDGLRDRLLSVKGAMDDTALSAGAQALGLNDVSSAAGSATFAANLYADALARQRGEAFTAAEANLNYRDSLVQAKDASDKKKGASIEEERALLRLVSASNDVIRTLDESGASAEVSGKKFDAQRGQLIKVATQMFGNKDAAIAYVDSLLQIPTSRSTKATLDNRDALVGVSNTQRAINGLRGKTVYVNVIRSGNFSPEANDIGAMHGPSRRALGGPVRAGEPYIVGEKRAELFVPNQNGVIVPNLDDLKSSNRPGLGKAAASMPPIHITVQAGYITTPAQLEAQLERVVNTLIRKGKLDGVRS